MLRVLNVLIVLNTIIQVSYSQNRKLYCLENNDQFDKVILFLKATSNSCLIRPVENNNIISVYTHSPDSVQEPNINSTLTGRTDFVHINDDRESGFFMTSMTSRFFKKSPDYRDQWDYYLSNRKPLQLNLDYAIGDAEVELSGLPVERLMIRTGNADVKVEYQENMPNLVTMDTLFAKVDMGSLTINRINYANVKNVIADVVFGGLFIDYTRPPEISSKVKASVGAGTLVISLPEAAHIPVVVTIHDSPLCHVRLPKGFIRTGKNEFVNEYYKENPEKSIFFDLDVAVGHIHFVNP